LFLKLNLSEIGGPFGSHGLDIPKLILRDRNIKRIFVFTGAFGWAEIK
tara:strand:- start:245 stop:388 length:144 start_codon:yes stop_codon:yes gene_type:complete